jgi:hypothetical protein
VDAAAAADDDEPTSRRTAKCKSEYECAGLQPGRCKRLYHRRRRSGSRAGLHVTRSLGPTIRKSLDTASGIFPLVGPPLLQRTSGTQFGRSRRFTTHTTFGRKSVSTMYRCGLFGSTSTCTVFPWI